MHSLICHLVRTVCLSLKKAAASVSCASSLVCFHFSPKELSEEEKDSLNLQISKQIVSSGYAGVFTTELNGKKVLRLCFIHPETTKEYIRNTLGLLEKYCRRLLKKTLRDEIPA